MLYLGNKQVIGDVNIIECIKKDDFVNAKKWIKDGLECYGKRLLDEVTKSMFSGIKIYKKIARVLCDPPILHYAIYRGRYEIVRDLLRGGANPNLFIKDENLSPLHVAMMVNEVNVDIVKVLLKYGADIHLKGVNKPQYYHEYIRESQLSPYDLCIYRFKEYENTKKVFDIFEKNL